MARMFHPLLALIASATDRELAKYVEYLKQENRILRARLPTQVHTTVAERRVLLRYGRPVGKAIEELITMVTPGTFYRWCRDVKKATTKTSKPKGGQRKPRDLRKLVLWMAQETNFGLTRILGELRKLGIKRISRQTVRNILKEESIPPQPDRPTDSWDKFLRRHGETLWGCDFFTVRTVTRRGIRHCYLLVFLNIKTREAIVSPATEHPNSKWVCRQATAFIEVTASRSAKPSIVLHDRDTKFTHQFKDTLKNAQVRPSALPKTSPNLNGRTERFGGSLKRECLSKFIFFGKQHLDYVVSLYIDYYNQHRAHAARENLPPIRVQPPELEKVRLEDIQVKTYVGGLVSSFERKAA